MIRRLALTATTRGIGAISLLVLYWVAARHLNDADTGRVFVVLTISTVAMPLLLAGRNALLVREIPSLEHPSRVRALIQKVVRSHLATVVPIAGALMAIALIVGRPRGELAVTASIVVIVPTLGLLGAVLQGLKRLNAAVAIVNIIMPMIFAILLELASALDDQVTAELALYRLFPLACVVAGLVAILFVRFGLSTLERNPLQLSDTASEQESVKIINADLLFFWLVYVMIALNNWAPQLIYYLFATKADYAHFSAAQRVANIAQFVIIVANFAVAPYVAEAVAKKQFFQLEKMYVQVSRLMTLIAVPVTIIMIVFASSILRVFGDSFSGAENLLRVFCVMQLYDVVTGVKNAVLNMGGKQRELFTALGIAFLVGLVSLPVLVWLFHSLGYALAVAVTLVTQSTLSSWFVWRAFEINPFRALDPRYRPPLAVPENAHV